MSPVSLLVAHTRLWFGQPCWNINRKGNVSIHFAGTVGGIFEKGVLAVTDVRQGLFDGLLERRAVEPPLQLAIDLDSVTLLLKHLVR